MQATKFETVNEYFSGLPPKTRNILKELRKSIKEAAPQAEELISYNMPAFKLHGVLDITLPMTGILVFIQLLLQ